MLVDTGQYLALDVSMYQGRVDWAMVRRSTGIRHALIRVNDINGVDPWFLANADAALADGWAIGGYVYCFLTQDVNAVMASVFAQVHAITNGRPLPLPLMLDVEDNRNSTAFLTQAQRHTWLSTAMALQRTHDNGRPGPIYTGGWYWNGRQTSSGLPITQPPYYGAGFPVGDHPLILSGYPFHSATGEPINGWPPPADYRLWGSFLMPRAPRPIAPWSAWSGWQFTSSADIPGVATRCDVNLFESAWIDALGAGDGGTTPIEEGDDVAKVYDVDGTMLLSSGLTCRWLDDGGRVEDAIRIWGNPIGVYERTLKTMTLVGPAPSYPPGWNRFVVTADMFAPAPPGGGSGGASADEVRAAVRAELDAPATAAMVNSAVAGALARTTFAQTFKALTT